MSGKKSADADIAETLKLWRSKMGYSQADASRVLGISVDSVQNWEIRRYVPNGTVRALLLRRLEEDLRAK